MHKCWFAHTPSPILAFEIRLCRSILFHDKKTQQGTTLCIGDQRTSSRHGGSQVGRGEVQHPQPQTLPEPAGSLPGLKEHCQIDGDFICDVSDATVQLGQVAGQIPRERKAVPAGAVLARSCQPLLKSSFPLIF